MLSLDSNLLLYAFNRSCPEHAASWSFVESLAARDDVAISEFVLAEFYVLLRNPAVVRRPLSAAEAVASVQAYRRHPRWRLIGFPPEGHTVMDRVWKHAAETGCARHRIYDARLAVTLRAQGVTEFATRNVKDFEGLGFDRVFDPLAEP